MVAVYVGAEVEAVAQSEPKSAFSRLWRERVRHADAVSQNGLIWAPQPGAALAIQRSRGERKANANRYA